ncbi:MAG TPA: hypothetical protein VF062_04405 [Candidatus Limnocylindrales bacterium]
MRLETGRLVATALAGLALAGASACGKAAPDASAETTASATTTASAGAGDSKTACDAVIRARKTALDALAPVSIALAGNGLSADGIAKATDDLKAAFTTMHLGVAAAAEHAGDPDLKAKLSEYQMSVEQAIVVVEGADGDRAELASAIELPAMRSAEKAVMDACP